MLNKILGTNHSLRDLSAAYAPQWIDPSAQAQDPEPDPEDYQDQTWFDTLLGSQMGTSSGMSTDHGEACDPAMGLPEGGDFMTGWLSNVNPIDWRGFGQLGQPSLDLPSHAAVSDSSGTTGSVPDDSAAIQNVWGLLVALESGKESVHVSAGLIRQLLADAAQR